MKKPEKTTKGNATRASIVLALNRIEKGRAKIVASDRRISIASVAEEAGVSRALIHNNYPEIAERILGVSGKGIRRQRDKKRSQLLVEQNRNRALREENSRLRELNRKMATEVANLTALNEHLSLVAGNPKVVAIGR